MASIPTTTKQWLLTHPPTGAPILDPNHPTPTFTLATSVPVPSPSALEPDQLLCRAVYFSNDTGLRNFIQTTVAPSRFYVPTVPVGSPMRSGVIAEVLAVGGPSKEGEEQTFKPGDMVLDFHLGSWSEMLVLSKGTSQKLAPLPGGLSVTHYLGAFGASGLAAWCGLVNTGGIKAEHTVVISAAAGATGSVAVQIAKKIFKANKVIGIAGGQEKCKWVVEGLGADICVDYKKEGWESDLEKATEGEVDLYFDNVGGAVLDVMLTRMKKGSTVAVCGAVGEYNSDEPMKLKNWFEVISSRIKIQGFIMLDIMDEVPAILGKLIGAAAEGTLDLSQGETVVEGKIEEQPEIWMRLFSGGNQGKLLTKLIPSSG